MNFSLNTIKFIHKYIELLLLHNFKEIHVFLVDGVWTEPATTIVPTKPVTSGKNKSKSI